MNRNTFSSLLLLALICSSAFAITSLPNQSKLQKTAPNALSKSHLGRALLNMVQLGAAIKYEQSDLYNALEDLRLSLVEAKELEDESYIKDETVHLLNVSLFESAIETLKSWVQRDKEEIEEISNDLSNERGNLVQQQNELQQAQEKVESLQSQLQGLRNKFQEDNNDFSSAIEALNEALNRLEDAQQHYQNSRLEAFAQVTSQFNVLAQKITKATANLRKDHLLMIKPVVLAMTQVNSSTEQSSIQRAIDAVRDVRNFLVDGQVELQAVFDRQQESLNNEINAVQAIADSLSQHVIPATEGRISGLEDNLKGVQELLETHQNELSVNESNLENENLQWVERTERHNSLIHKYNEEIQIVLQAVKVLRDNDANNQ